MPDFSLVCIGCVLVEIGIGLEDIIVDEEGFEEGNIRIGSCGGTVAGVETFSGGGVVVGMRTGYGMGTIAGMGVMFIGEFGFGVGVVGFDEVCGLYEGWGPNMKG
jgi:hypothetical protein